MVTIIEDEYLSKVFSGKVIKSKPYFNSQVLKKFVKTIIMLQMADSIRDIRSLRGLNFEALKGDLKGKYSVRVDGKYRLILRIERDEILVEDILVVEEMTNHYQ